MAGRSLDRGTSPIPSAGLRPAQAPFFRTTGRGQRPAPRPRADGDWWKLLSLISLRPGPALRKAKGLGSVRGPQADCPHPLPPGSADPRTARGDPIRSPGAALPRQSTRSSGWSRPLNVPPLLFALRDGRRLARGPPYRAPHVPSGRGRYGAERDREGNPEEHLPPPARRAELRLPLGGVREGVTSG